MIPYGRQSINDDDIAAVVEALRSDYLTTGPRVGEFEEAFADFCGARYAVGCSSGTAALHLAMLATQPPDNCFGLTTPITFASSALCFHYVGGAVGFVDVDEYALLDPERLEYALQQSDRQVHAVVAVDFAGLAVDRKRLRQLSQQYGFRLIIDACHSLGGGYVVDGERYRVGSCAWSDLTVFSLHPVKHITTGEGGMITTNDPDLYQRLCMLRTIGVVRDPERFQRRDQAFSRDSGAPLPWYYEVQEAGYNYRMSDLQSALGKSQLKRAHLFVEKRRKLAQRYADNLRSADVPIRPLHDPAVFPDHAWHLLVVLIPFSEIGISREGVMVQLRQSGIGTQVHYIPLYRQPVFADSDARAFRSAESYYGQCLSLPLFPDLEPFQVDMICDRLIDILRLGGK